MFSLTVIVNPLRSLSRSSLSFYNLNVFRANYSTPSISLGKSKKFKQSGATLEKKVLPVETDPNKLVKYCCGSNIMKEGNDVELKPDSEYPSWLWSLHIGTPKKLGELDPNTLEYWRKVRKMGKIRNNKLLSLRKY